MGRLLEELKQDAINNKIAPKGYSIKALKLDNYIDNVETFYQEQPFFFDETGLFWMWDKQNYKYKRTDEISMMNLIDEQLGFGGQTVTAGIRSNYLEAFKRVGRKHIPENPPKTWIQFKNKIIDIKTKQEITANPKYFIVNSINQQLGTTGITPTIDKLFKDWQGTEYQTLYEIVTITEWFACFMVVFINPITL